MLTWLHITHHLKSAKSICQSSLNPVKLLRTFETEEKVCNLWTKQGTYIYLKTGRKNACQWKNTKIVPNMLKVRFLFGSLEMTFNLAIQTESLGCVLWRRTGRHAEQTTGTLRGNTRGLWGLIAGLLWIQRIYREQDADSRNTFLHHWSWRFPLWILPVLVRSLVVNFAQLMQPHHVAFQDFHAGDCFCDSSAWASEHHLSYPVVDASCCNTHYTVDLAPLFDTHM